MRNTLILVIVAIALGAYVYFYEIKGEDERKKEQELQEKLISFVADSIESFSVIDFNKKFSFMRNGDNWDIIEPVETIADKSTVNSYLGSLTRAKKERTLNVSMDKLSDYGLADPSVKVYVTAQDGSRDSLYMGIKTSVGNNMYAGKGDTTVFISPISLKNNTQKTLFSWRDKKVLHFTKNEVNSFNLKSPQGSFNFEKSGSDWNLTKPIEAKGDNTEINSLLNKLDFGRIKSVAAESASQMNKYELNAPKYTIELFSGPEKAKSTVVFSALEDNKAYGKNEVWPHIFEVDSIFMQPFNKTLFNFRDKDLVSFNKDDINRVNLLYQGELMTFSKDSVRWHLATEEPIKNYKIVDLVSAVEGLKVNEFVAENPSYLLPYGLTNPAGVLELFSDNDKIVELQFGIEKNDRIFIRNPRTGQVVAIDKVELEDVLLKKEDILDNTSS